MSSRRRFYLTQIEVRPPHIRRQTPGLTVWAVVSRDRQKYHPDDPAWAIVYRTLDYEGARALAAQLNTPDAQQSCDDAQMMARCSAKPFEHEVWRHGYGRPVKSLSWLVRHAKEVERLALVTRPSGQTTLEARLRTTPSEVPGSYLFLASFDRYEDASTWVQRPSLAGVPAMCWLIGDTPERTKDDPPCS